MRITASALAASIVAFAATVPATPGHAAMPKSILALFAPSIGYMLYQSDLCQWDLTDRIKATYKADFAKIGLTAAQQATLWQQVADREKGLASIPDDARARMKADTCTQAFRGRLEADLTN